MSGKSTHRAVRVPDFPEENRGDRVRKNERSRRSVSRLQKAKARKARAGAWQRGGEALRWPRRGTWPRPSGSAPRPRQEGRPRLCAQSARPGRLGAGRGWESPDSGGRAGALPGPQRRCARVFPAAGAASRLRPEGPRLPTPGAPRPAGTPRRYPTPRHSPPPRAKLGSRSPHRAGQRRSAEPVES